MIFSHAITMLSHASRSFRGGLPHYDPQYSVSLFHPPDDCLGDKTRDSVYVRVSVSACVLHGGACRTVNEKDPETGGGARRKGSGEVVKPQ